uniref:hypothetical protein n=1 Tax=Cephaleuros parasiticus TaxID=173370 RepID=UPI001EE0354B|nr:hypothetical protein MFQ79_pgp047 [Cephaleuros parasiticus]UIB39015.1 hypothetical protein [Cephaleuros parasiticus]
MGLPWSSPTGQIFFLFSDWAATFKLLHNLKVIRYWAQFFPPEKKRSSAASRGNDGHLNAFSNSTKENLKMRLNGHHSPAKRRSFFFFSGGNPLALLAFPRFSEGKTFKKRSASSRAKPSGASPKNKKGRGRSKNIRSRCLLFPVFLKEVFFRRKKTIIKNIKNNNKKYKYMGKKKFRPGLAPWLYQGACRRVKP